ncbi:MAG: hypothetical protein K2N14_00005, partial [Clostridia bacterium]|nr:hypothetical protein [Clostridia bacterium]
DYNGALDDDLPFENPHKALESDAYDDDKTYIANPHTHEFSYDEESGKVYTSDGKEIEPYEGDDDKWYYKDADGNEQPYDTSVLMIHNFRRNYYTGTETYFTSSTTITLEASTACEISFWVKTSDLYFQGSDTDRSEVVFERGAYAKIASKIGGNEVDTFEIKNINTEKLIEDNEDIANSAKNGWVQYTVFVEASSFATTSVTLTFGLGENDRYTVEGYAFFDDVTFTKYMNKAEMSEKNAAFGENIREIADDENPNVAYPLAPDGNTTFRVDKEVYQSEDENNPSAVKPVEHVNNSNDRYFYIDFASSTPTDTLPLESDQIFAGLTVEETSTGNYTSAKYNANENAFATNVSKLENGADTAYIPNKLENGIDVSDDIIKLIEITSAEDWKFEHGADFAYSEILTNALKTAPQLPGVKDGKTDALVILSALGASYEAQLTRNEFTLADGEYALVSFWLKTSNMNGKTAATITVSDVDDADNSQSFAVDSTTQPLVNIGDAKDVYNGWVKCFVRVSNLSKADKQFKITVNFGTNTIKGTSISSYEAGWLALTNVSIMNVDKDVYSYTSNASNTATLSFTETEEITSQIFDSEAGDKNVIKSDLATPSSYKGVNGNSINVAPTGESASEYDKTNSNGFAGLLSRENIDNYTNKDWFSILKLIVTKNENAENDDVWKAIFDDYTVQPLLIVNTARKFADKAEQKYNYGYIGNNSTVSANGYVAVSVRVKASDGAIANVYLVEGGTTDNNVLNYVIPKYTFWYDDDGNILKGEPKEDATAAEKKANIAYTLRKDGLYENGDGKLYANFYNLSKYYDYKYQHNSFYAEDCTASSTSIPFENLVQGNTYYADTNKTEYAPHHLIAGGNQNSKVYEYRSGTGADATYYYVENQKANTSKVVYGIDTTVAPLRYDGATAENTPYQFTIDTTKTPEYANKWITVTFYIHAGSESKNYRLELWSGERDKETSYDNLGDSYVMFDYSSISLDATTFDNIRGVYTNEIITDYREKITTELEDNDANIAELEAIAGENNRSELYDYKAVYYTFSLFDSEAFIPFNGETADSNQSGYSFNYSESEESLAYFKVEDKNNLSMSTFIDYSVIDKDVDIIGIPSAPDHDHNDETETPTDRGNALLLAASILLVVAIFVAMAAIFIRDIVKKHSRKKTAGKNSYNFNKNKRYVTKYVKANGEAPEVKEAEVDESLLSDKPAETAEPAPSTESEAPAENAETEAPAEQAGDNSEAETPAEESKDEKPEDGDENK